ncbi:hypothetical protein [Dyadobacter bucti]|jgi:hypothetical protein|uniref:hypothetical protein n=1 Tax=Dyadobacter bucti TaxID=2572203 RepID=UPI003F7031C1
MDNEILIRLFEKKDRKRRKILYSLYQDYFGPGLSSVFIAETINGDLGTPGLVTVGDIKYCRFYFHGKMKNAVKIRSPMVMPSKREEKAKASDSRSGVQWSDPDELSTSQNQIIKSKFSK